MARFRNLLLIGLIVGISILHYTTNPQNIQMHEFYRRLYYIPIILSSFQFGLRGGLIVSLISGLLYAPHLLLYVGSLNVGMINQLSEIFLFLIVGVSTGSLVEGEWRQKHRLEKQYQHTKNIENYTDSILQSIGSGVMAVDQKGRITRINRACRNILGLTNDQYDPTNVLQDLPTISAFIDRVLKSDNLYQREEIKIQFAQKRQRILVLQTSPLRTAEQYGGLVVVFEDLTEIRNLEDRVKRGERLAAVGQLAAGVAHEIRNPLAIIKTITQTLQGKHLESELVEALVVINEETDRANLVVQGLLDLARVKPLNMDRFELNSLLTSVVSSSRQYATTSGVQIKFDPQGEIQIDGDQEQLRQVFVNLSMNAVQATAAGGEVSLQVDRQSDSSVCITFRDEGKGIPLEELRRVGEPFFTTKAGGTGLGLAISLRIVEAHGGSILIDSEPGLGTNVRVSLPMGGVNNSSGDDYR